MRIRTILCLLLLAVTGSHAQRTLSAKDVLDTAAEVFEHKGGVSAWFRASTFVDGTEQASIEGNMRVLKDNFNLATNEMSVWFDGTTQWTYIPANGEVNVSEPTEEEQEQMNPYTFINLYKKGYALSMATTTLRDVPCYEVTLTARDKDANLPLAIISIDKKDFTPMLIRLQQKDTDNWSHISIYNFSREQQLTKKDFTFDTTAYPNADIIDLR